MAHAIIERIRIIGPYIALELLMPGGTMFAFLLYLYRRKIGMAQRPSEANTPAMTGTTPQVIFLAANP